MFLLDMFLLDSNLKTPVSREDRIISCVISHVTFRDRTLFCRPDGPVVPKACVAVNPLFPVTMFTHHIYLTCEQESRGSVV